MKITAFLGLVLVIAFGMSGLAAAKGLPKTFAWTAYGTTSSGYASSVNIGNALAAEGYKLRVMPGKNDISRMTPVKTGQAQFSAMGVGSYLAQEGVFDFGAPKWGPQPVRLLMMCWGDHNTANVACAKDANIKTAADLKGKRLTYVIGSPALNQAMAGFLAFGGLTWEDVIMVKVPGWKQSVQAVIDGNADGVIASTNSSMLYQLAGSPRGLSFFPAPPEDKAAWKRLKAHAPWFAPHVATVGVGLSKEKPHVGGSYGYPILITYERMDDQAVYELMKLMHTLHPKYVDGHNSGPGWAMDRQVFDWIVPYHDGAVKYLKEIGVWNDKFQKNNEDLIKRQGVLAAAWKKTKAEKKGGKDFLEFWMKKRKEALKTAGMDPIW
jgi:TRAP transporter TAXI family solute receptor